MPDEEIREALEEICRRYWHPARKFLHSLGCGSQDAEDIAQTFFAHWANPESMERLDPEKGRLRSYLKQSLRRHYINHWRAKQTQRRGSGEPTVSLDEIDVSRFDEESADLKYDVAWAETVLGTVIARMSQAYASRGKGLLFEKLSAALPGGVGLQPYAELAVSEEMKVAQIKIEVHRLRRRFADELRREVASTLANEDEIEDELRHLVRVMAHVHDVPE